MNGMCRMGKKCKKRQPVRRPQGNARPAPQAWGTPLALAGASGGWLPRRFGDAQKQAPSGGRRARRALWPSGGAEKSGALPRVFRFL